MRHLFFVPLALLCLAPTIHADPTADARKAIQADDDRKDAAFTRLDPVGTLQHKTLDFVSVGTEGSTNLDKERGTVKRAFSAAKSARSASHIQSIVLKDGGAVVVSNTKATLVRTSSRTGKLITLVDNQTSREFWVKTSGVWKCKRSRTLKETTMVDGRVVTH